MSEKTPMSFEEYLCELSAMNGSLVDNIARDIPHLAALTAGDRMKLFAHLTALQTPETVIQELQKEIDRLRTKKKSNKPQEPVSLRIERNLIEWGYDLWLNEMDEDIFDGIVRLTDPMRAELRMRARDAGYAELRLMSALDDAVLAIANKKRRHPVREYLSGLVWDGQDHIGTLAAYFEDDHELITYADGTRTVLHAFLRRWLIGSIAKMFGDNDARRSNFVLVLSAQQDLGKSHFAQWLCPLPEYFIEKHISPDEKDDSLQRARTWIWEIGELGATTKRSDHELLKAFITATKIRERKAYGRHDTVAGCVASYIGTVNADGGGFLTDTTGNRRFAVVNVLSADWSYDQQVDAAQVWAQAMELWKSEPKGFRFSIEEKPIQVDNAEAQLAPDIYGDMLARTFVFDKGHTDWSLSSSQILEHLRMYAGLSRGSEIGQGREIARALKKHWGIEGKRSHGLTVYHGLALLYPKETPPGADKK